MLKKMFTDLCDTGAICVRILVELTLDSSLCSTSYLTLLALRLLKPGLAW